MCSSDLLKKEYEELKEKSVITTLSPIIFEKDGVLTIPDRDNGYPNRWPSTIPGTGDGPNTYPIITCQGQNENVE